LTHGIGRAYGLPRNIMDTDATRETRLVEDLRNSALIVVDMQNDFLATGGYYDVKDALFRARGGALDGDDLAYLAAVHAHPPANHTTRRGYGRLVERVRRTAGAALAAGVRTIFVRAAYEPQSTVRPPLFIGDPDRQDYACHPGSWGAELVAPLQPLAGHANAIVVTKPTFDAFHATDLGARLTSKGITTVYLAGVETNVCVLFTALSALSNGFATTILEDAVGTSRPDLHTPTLRILEVAKAGCMETADFMARLRPQEEPNPENA